MIVKNQEALRSLGSGEDGLKEVWF